MALWTCTGCTTAYAVGAPRCPHCGSRDHVEEGTVMPKITVHGGPSNEYAEPTAEGSEQSSPGTSSSASSETQSNSPASTTKTPSPARTTGNRSRRARTDSSSAAGTDGGRTAPTSASDDHS